MQVSHSNDALRHAIVAIGSLHESLSEGSNSPWRGWHIESRRTFAFLQCNKAISVLLQPVSERLSEGILLVSCLLFMTFEILQDHWDTALDHLRSGIRILETWNRSKPSDPNARRDSELVEDYLSPIFSRYQGSSETVHEMGSSTFKTSSPAGHVSVQEAKVPKTFSNLHHARNWLHTVLEATFSSVRDGFDDIRSQMRLTEFQSRIQQPLQLWHTTFVKFLDMFDNYQDKNAKRGICMLKIHYLVASILLATLPFKDEMLFDAYVDDFREIVSLCSDFAELEKTPKSQSASHVSFSFDLSIIMPLYLTATRCREPKIRRAARDLLLTMQRREGLWQSGVTGLVVQQVIKIEESGLSTVASCQDILPQYRIRLMQMHYDPGSATSPAA